MNQSLPPALFPQGPRPAPARPNAKSVLVVEDDTDLRRILVKALGAKYNVYEAGNGAEALNALAAMPVPDLIVSDVMMPHLDGFMMARRLKAYPETSRIPIVFLTARGAPHDIVHGINSGARQYITKPFKIADLVGRVAKILG